MNVLWVHVEFRKFALFVRIGGVGVEMVFIQLFRFFSLNAAFAAELSILFFFSSFFQLIFFLDHFSSLFFLHFKMKPRR